MKQMLLNMLQYASQTHPKNNMLYIVHKPGRIRLIIAQAVMMFKEIHKKMAY